MRGEAKSIEVSAKTVEEAIAKGLAQLGRSEDEVEIEVLKRGSRGFLGFGAEEAKVRITYYEPLRVDEVAREALSGLLSRMGIEARVVSRKVEGSIVLDIKGEDLGILIGRRGETLGALQHITRMMVNHKLRSRTNLVVDVEGYKARRAQALRRLALRMAEKVAFSHEPVTLEPMPPYERRIIHLALRDHPHVTTKSVGEGARRRVTIIPKR